MKKLSITTIVTVLLISMITSFASAVSNVPNARILNTNDGAKITAKTITIDDLPEGVTPIYVSSKAEADTLAVEGLSMSTNIRATNESDMGIMSTTSTQTVDSAVLGWGTVYLKVNYQTSGDNNTGVIVYASPFTEHTGFTWGIQWTQQNIGGYITDSGKDYFAYCSGTVGYYIFYEGIGTFYSRTLNMSGLAWIIR